MITSQIQQKLGDIAEKIVGKFAPQKIILFGSFAWGKPGADSDVDLLIIKDTEDVRETARQIDSSLFPRPFPMDIIVYTPDQIEERRIIGDFFMKDILTKGKVLYGE